MEGYVFRHSARPAQVKKTPNVRAAMPARICSHASTAHGSGVARYVILRSPNRLPVFLRQRTRRRPPVHTARKTARQKNRDA